MLRVIALTHARAVQLQQQLTDRLERRDQEQGSVTVEHVLWAVAVIVIVGIVYAAIKTYVTNQASNIK